MHHVDLPRSSVHPLTPANFPDAPLDLGIEAGDEQSIVLAGGCFWCVEAVFRQLAGVRDVVSGYAGGTAQTADYRTVCSGATDHAEVAKVVFDARVITLGQLLKVFFAVAHDPTHLNRQGNDVGRQYRSAVFYADDAQREVVQRYMETLTAARVYADPIVTTLEPLAAFYPAEDYHQNYAALNPHQPYIAGVSQPKVDKVRRYFSAQLAD
ncbi:peptide-methionine (S)-S-oxide reductase MsrA [Sinimarinibacterium sp. NLF-5-8]|uniref:peptide-methionine (S)-S-oxide reductase MsrA n=1 Tax=Sinimarinibacterium sp. NLF-5-8 TaxID=2698684 RepID=UPI00137BE04A|nr:peptide-methionine (S)-S-oxide reductase MsrA [Sinimarinibacterium sp. NLF-5-8]QHS08977.1 peptide-methionine (S)-S-oxide reductase MsrA [Sinimarinibacterium sp. NLF-5-8]